METFLYVSEISWGLSLFASLVLLEFSRPGREWLLCAFTLVRKLDPHQFPESLCDPSVLGRRESLAISYRPALGPGWFDPHPVWLLPTPCVGCGLVPGPPWAWAVPWVASLGSSWWLPPRVFPSLTV